MSEAISSSASAKLAAIAGFALKACLRALLVAVVVGIAIAIGLAIPVKLQNWIAAMPPAGLAFGAAALLGVMRGLFESLPTAWEFVVNATADTLPKIFAQVAVAALGIGFAYFAAIPNGDPGRSLNLSVSGSLPPVVMNDSDSLLTAYVVFDEWEATLAPTDGQIQLVNNLVDSLATCVQSPNDRIDITVRAYASSYGSDGVNETLFKKRGQYVSELLARQIQSKSSNVQAQFHVEVRDWKSLQLMKIRRLFKDTDDSGAYLKQAGALNRRAEIRVRSAGSCLPN